MPSWENEDSNEDEDSTSSSDDWSLFEDDDMDLSESEHQISDHEDSMNQDPVPRIHVHESLDDESSTTGSLTIWSINLKRSDKRLGALRREIARITQDSPHRRPDIIAVQDPSPTQAYSGLSGYNFWNASLGDFTEAENENLARQIERGRTSSARRNHRAQSASDTLTDATEDGHANSDDTTPLLQHVCFYVDYSIPATRWHVEDANTEANKGLVATLRLMTASDCPLSIHNVYNHKDRLDVSDLLSTAGSIGDNVLIGDFNFHHPDWSGDRVGRRTDNANHFAVGVRSVGMRLLTERGVVTFSNSDDTEVRSSTIDLTFASGRIAGHVKHCKVLRISGFESDHRVIETVVHQNVERKIRPRRLWTRADPRRFTDILRLYLPSIDDSLDDDERINEYYLKILEAVYRAMRRCVPQTSGTKRQKRQRAPTRLESEQKATLDKHAELVEKYQCTKDEKLLPEIDRVRLSLLKLGTQGWRLFTQEKTKTATGGFKLAKMGQKFFQPQELCQVPPLRDGDQYTHSDKDKAHVMKRALFRDNNAAASQDVPDDPPAKPDNGRPELKISQTLTDRDLRREINSLPKRKASGTDQIPNEAIQLGGHLLRQHLLRFFNACLQKGLHPSACKHSILKMLRKSGKPPEEPKSWRPIALLSTIGKLLERIVARRILDQVRKKPNLLPATQFGGRSTTEALQYLLNIVYDAWGMDPNLIVTIMCLDMGGAYDNVFRQKLLEMLVEKGMPRWVVDFIKSFLSNRWAHFEMPGLVSEPFRLNTGIPQGSPLSPVLFLLFATPLLDQLPVGLRTVRIGQSSKPVSLYAFSFVDDIYLIAVSGTCKFNCKALEDLHGALLRIAEPLAIVFAPQKYHVMHFKRHGRQVEDTSIIPDVAGFTEKPLEVMKILGIQVDYQLNWKAHVASIDGKVRRRIAYLSLISGSTWGPDLHTMRKLYLTKIRPVFTYACGAWFIRRRHGESKLRWPFCQELVNKLEALQSFCLHKISGAFIRTGGQILEKELNIQDIGTLLHSQASVQRAKAIFAADNRWRNRTRVLKNEHKNPSIVLFNDARSLTDCAFARLLASTNDDDAQQANERVMDEKKRTKLIKNYAHHLATGDCKKGWMDYVQKRRAERALNAKNNSRLKLPAALTEGWGRKSLGFYRDLSRAQSTMLLHCRTEVIGLNAHLNKISRADARL